MQRLEHWPLRKTSLYFRHTEALFSNKQRLGSNGPAKATLFSKVPPKLDNTRAKYFRFGRNLESYLLLLT
jgi:hypothetical protein